MNDIKIFESKEFGKVRTLEINTDIWFVGKDVANALGYKLERKAIIDHVDEEDVLKWNIPTSGGEQKMTIINESGLYSLILSSNLPNAKKFKRWVTAEILPSIRKTGSYGIGSRDGEVLKSFEKRIERLERQRLVPAEPFIPPTESDVERYLDEIGYTGYIDAGYFVDYYTSIGWVIGQNIIRNWKAVVRNWIRREF